MTTRLDRELALLYKVEAVYKIPAAPIARQLITNDESPLPDLIPRPPPWVWFRWPADGDVDLQSYWRDRDGR